MAAIDFPNSPTVGQTFSAAGSTWIWNGVTWKSATTTLADPQKIEDNLIKDVMDAV